MIKKIVNHKYNTFTVEEKEEIINLAISQLNNSMSRSKNDEKKKIMKEVLSYLKDNCDFNLEGFVRFRLKEYFVGLQEIKIPSVHIYERDDGSYKIVNEKDELLENNLIEGYIKELMEEEITYEDILISSLINLSPGKIIIHFDDFELIETLKNIFKDKIEVEFS